MRLVRGIQSLHVFFKQAVYSPALRLQPVRSFPLRPYPQRVLIVVLFLVSAAAANGQPLSLQNAVQTGINNYGTIKAKNNYLQASKATVKEYNVDYLPVLSFGAQESFGTVNGQFGPQIGANGLTTSSSGPVFASQNWNAAFGGLYLANVNWDIFTFGRIKEKVRVAETQVSRDSNDLAQEKFQHEIRIAGAYLNLLAAQRLQLSQQKNLERAESLRTVVMARTKNGLNAGVDSSLANAEVSNAKIALTNSETVVAEQATQLAQLMGVSFQYFVLDTFYVNRIPLSAYDSTPVKEPEHPLLRYYRSRIDVSRQQEKYYNRLQYPVISLVGILQTRGSGFESNYSEANPTAYNHSLDAFLPNRTNYLLGVGVTWNVTNIKRVHQQVAAQQFISNGLQNEYEVVSNQVKTQLSLADQKMKNAIANYREAPVQLKAASDAFLQKSVLYKNGLSDIVDLTQALYTLNRAETQRDIANNNVWQALLLKAAASGDFGVFGN